MTVQITITVNGEPTTRTVPPHRLLRDFLREDLDLTGTKGACDDGMCGACSVLLNGDVVKSCLVLAAHADDGEVCTVEGIESPDGSLHPVQQALLEDFGFQCGFCTPGLVMTMVSLVDSGERFDQDSAREALVGNICRCTGYTTVVDALLSAQDARHG